MSPAQRNSALQEELPLDAIDDFRFEIDVADLGLDPGLTRLLVGDRALCFLDFEATGLNPGDDDLIEAGAVLLEPGNDRATVFNSVIHSNKELTPFILRLTGIKQAEVDAAPKLDRVASALDAFIAGSELVAHNAAFEKSWLCQSVNPRFSRHGFLDTLELLSLVYPDSPNMKLDTFCRRYLGRGERHRALDDALDTARLVVKIFEQARAGNPAAANALEAMRRFNPASRWRPRLEKLPVATQLAVEAELATGPARGMPSQALPPQALSSLATAEQGPRLEAVGLNADAIEARMQDLEKGAACFPEFELRPGQTRLMRQVYETFAGRASKSVVLCEAGTGIGKTLAYLAVAIPFARVRGEQVIISTSSKVLQTQLLEKDIPAAARLLGYPQLRYTVMKGRANYICRARLDRFLESRCESPELLSESAGFASSLICAFAQSAGHGEVDRIPTVLSQLNPELERFKREVSSADSMECSRQTCESLKAECVFRSARQRLEGAEIAVVNHDLLLRWPPDYPPLRHLIIDEIHELVEKADAAYTRKADAVEILHRLNTVLGKSGTAEAVEDEQARDYAEEASEQVKAMGRAVLATAKSLGEEREFQFGRDELVIPPNGPGPDWKEIIENSGRLCNCLSKLAHRLASVGSEEENFWEGAAESLIDAADILEAALPYPRSDDYVFRLRGISRQDTASWRLVATPVSPAADFQMQVLDQVETLFGTSATLSVGSMPAGAVRELEFEDRSGGRYSCAPSHPSPFDYASNLRVIFLSDPTRPAELVDKMTRATAAVAKALGGRTLALFTSRDRMVKVANLLDPLLAAEAISLISPAGGGADPHELVETFRYADRAVLLGSRALWQGIDVPGEACQAVVIEKLPFDVPGDPLLEKRAAIIESEGGSAFNDQTLPRMLLRLKQMMGRLIRSPNDKGLIVIVEPRSDKRYFKRIVETVPEGAPYNVIPLRELDAALEGFSADLIATRKKTGRRMP